MKKPSLGPRVAALRMAAVVLAASSGWIGMAHAARPLTTDDADVIDFGACEWESFGARSLGGAGSAQSAWQTQVGCGAASQLQLSIGAGRSVADHQQTELLGLGGKWQFWNGGEGRPRLALAVGLNMLRVGDSAFVVHDNSVNIAATQELGRSWTGHANLGWSFNRSKHQPSTTWNLALERPVAPGWDATGEVFGDDRGSRWGALGLRWSLTKASTVNLGLAVGGVEQTTRLLSVGYKLAF